MGIYSLKMESAVKPEDVIQTPEEIGVDLNEVEKAIAGPEGIEAHADEVEAANETPDPVDEAAFAMFESEYNYNQLMEAIGIAELNEAAMGREMIYEAADVKGFIAKVKTILSKMFEAITKAFRSVIVKLDVAIKLDKKFVAKYKKEIVEGFNKGLEKPISGYKFSLGTEDFVKFLEKQDSEELSILKSFEIGLKKLEEGEATETVKELVQDTDYKTDILNDILRDHGSNENCDSIGSYTKLLKKVIFGDLVDDVSKAVNVNDIIKTLESDRDTRAIKDAYNKTKASYNKDLKTLTNWEKEITSTKYENTTLAFALCQYASSVIKYSKDVLNTTCSVYLSAAKTNRVQSRKLAHAFVKVTGKKVDPKVAPKTESGIGVFNGVNII